MKKQIKKKFRGLGGGLRETPIDERDFKLGNILKPIDLDKLPKEFSVGIPIEIHNQKESDACTGFAMVAALQFSEKINLSPEYQFSKIKEISGEWQEWGADLRQACKSAIKFGALEKKDSPLTLEKDGRDKIANWKNWPKELDKKAFEHRQKSYFKVT